jgi:transposase InsO family protein
VPNSPSPRSSWQSNGGVQGAGLIHHSDRGSQYAAAEYRDILQAAVITQSMSRKANCWDNAPMESFFGTLKTELVHHREYPDRTLLHGSAGWTR